MIFLNNSSEDIPPFSVMRPTGAAIRDDGQFYITVDKPNANFETWYEISGPFITPAGRYGVTVESPCWVTYDTGSPVYGQSWGAKSGQWTLSTGRDGFKVYGTVDASNSRMLVRQREVTLLKGKLDGDLEAGSTSSCVVWVESGACEYSVTIKDWLLASSTKIVDETPVFGMYINGIWWMSEAGACAVPS